MDCREAQTRLLEAERPEARLSGPVEAHLAGCAACSALRAQLSTLDGVIREQAPALPDGFELALRRRLKQRAPGDASAQASPSASRGERPGAGSSPPPARRWARRALAAAAVVLVATAAILAARTLRSPPGEPPPAYHRLKLAVEATRALDDVHFDLELPAGVRLVSEAGAAIGAGRHLRWRSSLRPGSNELELPLAARVRSATVRARLTVDGRSLTGSVTLGSASAAGAAPRTRSAGGVPGLQLAWNVDSTTPGGWR